MTDQKSQDETGSFADKVSDEVSNLTQDELMRVVRSAMPIAVVSLAVLALLYTMYFASDLILPVFLAIFLSIILSPLVRGLQRLRIPRRVGAMIALALLTGAIISALVNLSAPAEQWLQRLPGIQRDVEAKLWPVTQSIKQASEATESIGKLAGKSAGTNANSEVTIKSPSNFDRAFEWTLLTAVQFLIVVALTYFFLTQSSGRNLPIPKLPWLKHSDLIEEMLASVQTTINRFLQISAGIYLILGALTALMMYLLQMPNPVLWGALAAVLGFMPYVGPMIVFGCIAVVSLLTFDDWWRILTPPLAYGVITILEGNFVTPSIIGRKLKLNPIAVFLSILLWTWVWGMAGAILAVPILVIIVIVARHVALIIRDVDSLRSVARSSG